MNQVRKENKRFKDLVKQELELMKESVSQTKAN